MTSAMLDIRPVSRAIDDPRDTALPGEPPEGFRNLLHCHAAAERDRWRGLRWRSETAAMMHAVERRLRRDGPSGVAFGPSAEKADLLRLALRDLQYSTDPAAYPAATVGGRALRRRRLMMEAPDIADDPGAARAAERLKRIEARALRWLERTRVGPARAEAARRAARSLYRRAVFEQALPEIMRRDVLDVFAAGRRLDRWTAQVDDVPVEFSHALVPLLRRMMRAPGPLGRLLARRPGPVTPLHVCGTEAEPPRWASGLLSLRALARAVAATVPNANAPLLFDPDLRAAAVERWVGRDAALAPRIDDLAADPPLELFLALEAAAPEALGGGGGRRLGLLGSAILGEFLFSARDSTRDYVGDHPGLEEDLLAASDNSEAAPSLHLIS